MLPTLNIVLLMIVSIMLGFGIRSRINHRRLDANLGYMVGVTYFNVFPLWILLFIGTFPGQSLSEIGAVNWVKDSESMSVLLIMLLASVPLMMISRGSVARSQNRTQLLLPAIPQKFELWHLAIAYLAMVVIEFFWVGLGGSESHWAESKRQFMIEQGSVGMIVLIASTGIRYAFMFLLLERALAGNRWFYLALVAFALIELYSTGIRITVAQTLVVVFFCKLIRKQYAVPIAIVLVAAPVIYSMVVFTAARATMHRWEGQSVSEALGALTESVQFGSKFYEGKLSTAFTLARITESNSINVFSEVHKIYPSREPFLHGSTLIKPLVFWVPRTMWKDKPFNFPTIIGARLIRFGVSLNSTSMGEPYANFGVLGVFYIPILLLTIRFLFGFVESLVGDPRFIETAAFLVGFTVTRNGIIETVFPFALALFCCALFRTSKFKPRI